MDKNKTLAQDVLQKIGGKENIISVFHCATRLRFELQDQTKVNEEELKKVNGVLGIKKAGTSFQVI
ncbi:MAG: PTS transporter subunit EIIB, partial [Faecalibacillus intestinalis]